jgi:hypothetical protein
MATAPFQRGIDAAYRLVRCLKCPDPAVMLAACRVLEEAEAKLADAIAGIKREWDGIGEEE